MVFALPFKKKMRLVIVCVLAGFVLTSAVALYIIRYDIIWLQNCEVGLSARENCNFSVAEEKLLEAASAASHFSPPDKRGFSTDLALAQMYVAMGNFARANEYIDKMRSAADADNDVQNQLSVMSLHADCLYRQAKFEEARKVYTSMFDLAKKNEQTIFEIDAQFALTKIDILFSKLPEAEQRVQQLEELLTKLKQPTNSGVVLSIYSWQIAELKGRYKTASQMYSEADRLIQNQEKPSSALRLAIANNSCTFYLQSRNVVRAKNVGQRTLENCEKDFQSYFAGNLLHALRNMASVSLADNDLSRARHFIEREVEEVGKRLSHEHPFYGVALEHRAVLESREGKREEAQKDFKACQEIFEKSISMQNRFIADTLVDIAKIQLDANDIQSSSATCQRAIAMYKTFLPDAHPSVLSAGLVLAENYRRQNKPAMAKVLADAAAVGLSAADGR